MSLQSATCSPGAEPEKGADQGDGGYDVPDDRGPAGMIRYNADGIAGTSDGRHRRG
jgi:hypothetical protein